MLKSTNLYRLYFSRYTKVLVAAIISLAILGLAAAIIAMLFGKPIGDDYGGIATYRDNNRIEETFISLSTTGRYGQSIASSLLYGILGEKIVVLLPLVAIAWLSVIIFLYIKHILRTRLKNPQNLYLASAALSLLITFLVLFVNDTPQTTNLHAWVSYQLMFWPSGIITYTLPFLLLITGFYTLFLSGFGKRFSEKLKLILLVLVIFISSLFNEVQPATILAISIGLLVLSRLKFYPKLKQYTTLLLLSIPSTIIGLVALFFSPGRIQRSQILSTITPDSDGSLLGSVFRNLNTLTTELYFQPRELVLLVIVGAVAATLAFLLVKSKTKYLNYSKSLIPAAVATALVAFACIIVSVTLTVVGYGYSAGVYSRTMLLAQISYVIAIPFLVFVLSNLLLAEQRLRPIFAAGVVLLGLLFLISVPKYIDKILTQVNSSVTYHNIWLEQDKILKEAASDGVYNTVYLENPAVGVGDGFSLTCTGKYAKSTMWLNVQISQYYGNNDRLCAIDKPVN